MLQRRDPRDPRPENNLPGVPHRLQCVQLPTAPRYIPGAQPMNVVAYQPNVNRDHQSQQAKVIIQRSVHADGSINFAIGTKEGGIFNRDLNEVPLQRILDYVSPAELQRFETQEFIEEDEQEEQERIRRLLKPIRRRRKKSLLPFRSRLHGERLFHPSKTPDGAKRPRGRPWKNSKVTPLLNGTQPVQEQSITRTNPPSTRASSESFSVELNIPRRPQQYSMVTASGFAPPDTSEEDTSRDVSVARSQSPGPGSSPKRGKVEPSGLQYSRPTFTPMVLLPRSPEVLSVSNRMPIKSNIVDVIGDDTYTDEVESKPQLRTYDAPDASNSANMMNEEREPLLRQFQTRDQAHTSSTASSSSSSDSSMSQTITGPINQQPSQKQNPSAGKMTTPDAAPASTTNLNLHSLPSRVDVNHLPITPPSKSRPRRLNLTPHFPCGTSFHHGSLDRSSGDRPGSSASSKSAESSKPLTSPLKRKHFPEPQSSVGAKLKASRMSALEPVTDLTQANEFSQSFRPGYRPCDTPPRTAVEEKDEGVEIDEASEDAIVHDLSPDSLISEILVVQRQPLDHDVTVVAAEADDEALRRQLVFDAVAEGAHDEDGDNEDDEAEDDEHIKPVSQNLTQTHSSSIRKLPNDMRVGEHEIDRERKLGSEDEDDDGAGSDEDSGGDGSDSDSLSAEALVVER